MASFLEGVADGLVQGFQMEQQSRANNRAEALNLAKLGLANEELQIKRDDREKKLNFEKAMSDSMEEIYGYDEQVPVPGAIPDSSGQQQMTTKRSYYMMGEDSPEGRARDMKFEAAKMRNAYNSGQITSEMIDKSRTYVDHLNKKGLTGTFTKLLMDPKDPAALKELSSRFGVNPQSVSIETVDTDDMGRKILPQKWLTGVSGSGQQFRIPMTQIAGIMEVASYGAGEKDAAAAALNQEKIFTERSKQTEAKAKGTYYENAGKAYGAKTKKPSEIFQTSMKDQRPTFVYPKSRGMTGDYKPQEDYRGIAIANAVGEQLIGKSLDGAAAFTAAKGYYDTLNLKTNQVMEQVVAQVLANPKDNGWRTFEDEKDAKRALKQTETYNALFDHIREKYHAKMQGGFLAQYANSAPAKPTAALNLPVPGTSTEPTPPVLD
jgi:hypothetical protein